MRKFVTLGEHIVNTQKEFPFAQGELSRLLSSIRLAAKILNHRINRAGLEHTLMGYEGEVNIQGEDQKKLDVYANNLFIESLKARNEVCGIASEENEKEIIFDNESGYNGKYVVLIDPIDGSSNIEVNVSIGTVFAIYRRLSPVGTKPTKEDFLQCGTEQVAAGYVIFGSSTMLVYTTGHGVNGFTYDPGVGVFYLSHPNMKIPNDGRTFSVNEGHYSGFSEGLKKYLMYCKNEVEKPYTARYIGSMIADFHRNLLRGGIYMYPSLEGAPNGKLRLLYECNPMAFLAEQAGGVATDGKQRILELKPEHLHQRTPFYTGSQVQCEKLLEYVS